MGQPLEVTLTLLPNLLARAATGERIDIVARVRQVVPSVRYLAGNRNLSVTISLDSDHESELRDVASDLCAIAPRQYAQAFGMARRVKG